MLQNYELFLRVLRRWPEGNSKITSSYGRYLRSLIKSPTENCFPGSKEENTQKINSLLRLTENEYYKKSATQLKVGATGLKLEEIKIILSDEFLKKYNKAKNSG